MIIKRFFYLLFLVVLACSKDKDEEPEYVLKNYDVSVEATEGGTVSYAGGSIQAGQTVTVSATPADGYKFTGCFIYASFSWNFNFIKFRYSCSYRIF